jgi:hypothetical protein
MRHDNSHESLVREQRGAQIPIAVEYDLVEIE